MQVSCCWDEKLTRAHKVLCPGCPSQVPQLRKATSIDLADYADDFYKVATAEAEGTGKDVDAYLKDILESAALNIRTVHIPNEQPNCEFCHAGACKVDRLNT